jgi:hypothetical protein
MTVTVEPPPLETPDAGVIEEARARQRRHRAFAGATTAALAIAALLFAFLGGGDGGGSHRAAAPSPAGGSSGKTARSSSTSCLSSGRTLQGPPSKSLLSILGVLRRPATAADSIPGELAGRGLTRDVFVRYVRRTRVIDGSPYYIYPAIVGGCGVEKEHEGIIELATHIDLGAGAIGGIGGGGGNAADIEQARTVGSGPPGSATSTTITMIVPDGVANVTLHFPAGRASGYSAKISPPFTILSRPVGNELVLRIPRSHIPESVPGLRMIWRAADGRTVKRFNRL